MLTNFRLHIKNVADLKSKSDLFLRTFINVAIATQQSHRDMTLM